MIWFNPTTQKTDFPQLRGRKRCQLQLQARELEGFATFAHKFGIILVRHRRPTQFMLNETGEFLQIANALNVVMLMRRPRRLSGVLLVRSPTPS